MASKMCPKRSWTYFGSNLEPLGANLSLTWSVLGASWAQLEVSWTHFLNPSWVQLGASWAPRASLPGLLDAILLCTVGTGCTVQADLISKMIFGAPTCSLHSQLLERLFVICTPVCTALPGRFSASLCTVHPSVQLSLAFGAYLCALYTHMCCSPCPTI